MFKTGIIAVLCIATMACANTQSSNGPTHRWVSTSNADEVRYHNDHAQCSSVAELTDSQREHTADSAAFGKYKQCMNQRGYVLTAMRGN